MKKSKKILGDWLIQKQLTKLKTINKIMTIVSNPSTKLIFEIIYKKPEIDSKHIGIELSNPQINKNKLNLLLGNLEKLNFLKSKLKSNRQHYELNKGSIKLFVGYITKNFDNQKNISSKHVNVFEFEHTIRKNQKTYTMDFDFINIITSSTHCLMDNEMRTLFLKIRDKNLHLVNEGKPCTNRFLIDKKLTQPVVSKKLRRMEQCKLIIRKVENGLTINSINEDYAKNLSDFLHQASILKFGERKTRKNTKMPRIKKIPNT